jgi:hypothetical protein
VTSSDGSEWVTINFDADGYDISVEVNIGAINRELQRLEVHHLVEMGRDGPRRFDLDKFAQVKAEPTAKKWDELTERSLDSGGNQS